MPGGPARVVIGFLAPSGFGQDRTRIVVVMPAMVFETATKLVSILEEHGARPYFGSMVAGVQQCEQIGAALSKAGFDVVVDPEALAASRAALAAAKAERN